MSKKLVLLALSGVVLFSTASYADVKSDCKRWLKENSKRNPSEEVLEKRCTCVAKRTSDSAGIQKANEKCKDAGQ